MKTLRILTSRPVGEKCAIWAKNNVPKDWDVVVADHYDPRENDDSVVISVLFDTIIDTNFLVADVDYFNFHPGILPQYAGSATLSWSIFNGEEEAGITLHILTSGVDTGAVIDVRTFPILEQETGQTLWNKAEETIFEMFQNWLPELLDTSELTAIKQDTSERKVYKRKDLEQIKDVTRNVRALTFKGKDKAFFVTKDGKKWELDFNSGARLIG